MACLRCRSLTSGQLMHVFNEQEHSWSIGCVQHVTRKKDQNDRECATVIAVKIVNTESVIPSIRCTDFKQKWQFIDRKLIAKMASNPIIFPATFNLSQHYIEHTNDKIDQISEEEQQGEDKEDEDIADDDAKTKLNETEKKTEQQPAQTQSENTSTTKTQTDVRHIGKKRTLSDYLIMSDDDNTNAEDDRTANTNTSNTVEATATNELATTKRRKLTPKQDENVPLVDTTLPVSSSEADETPFEMPSSESSAYEHEAPRNKRSRVRTPRRQKQKLKPTKAQKQTNKTKTTKKPKKQTMLDDAVCFERLDKFYAENESRFPAFNRILEWFNLGKMATRALVLRYFRHKQDRKTTSMEAQETEGNDEKYVKLETGGYRCTECHQQYGGANALRNIKKHCIIHTDSAVKCPVCWRAFQSAGHVLSHIRQTKDSKNAHSKYYETKLKDLPNKGGCKEVEQMDSSQFHDFDNIYGIKSTSDGDENIPILLPLI